MRSKLVLQAIIKYITGLVFIGLLLFVPAGTLLYWNGWLLIGLLFIPILILGIVLLIKDPELLRKRLNSKEKENEQKLVQTLGALMFVCGFVVAGLNYRFSWLVMPNWLVVLGSVIFFLSYLGYAEVMRENRYLSRIIEVQENQKVIDTGLYGIVRHPMYSTTIFLFLSMGIVLGSLFSFLIFLIYPIIIGLRIRNEEAVLENELNGYAEYKKKVKYKVIPFIW